MTLIPLAFDVRRLVLAAALGAPVLATGVPDDGSVFATPLAWKKLAAGATRRFASTAVFDPKRESVLVFAGETHENEKFGLLDDLWEYKPKDNSWQEIDTKGPTPPRRAYHAAAFDEKQGVMWVLGGAAEDLTAMGDFWKLDTATMTWTEVKPAGDKPGARFSANLHHDAARGRLVLHSGCKAFFAPDNGWEDLWAFDIEKSTWSKQKSAAPPRWQAASAFVPDANALIVHGGFDGNSSPCSQTWVYSFAGDKWTDLGKGFKMTEAHGAVWDPLAQAMIVYGGTSGAKIGLDQLWKFDPKSKKWSQLQTKGETPGGRAYHALLWNPIEKGIWAFGGTQNQFMDEPRANDAWSLQLHK